MQQKPIAPLERILSANIFEGFGGLFTNVLNKALQCCKESNTDPVYVVVITRRCYVLFFSYYTMLCECVQNPDAARPAFWKQYSAEELKDLEDVFKSCVITDNAAWSMAYDIAFDYQKNGSFPRLIVVDELLFHGRALNGFLYGLEKRLLHAESLYLEKFQEPTSPRRSIQEKLLEKLAIYVGNWNANASVLLPRYQKILIQNCPGSALPIETWRNYSIAYAQYVSICNINNVGFSLGISIPTQQDSPVLSNVKSSFTMVSTQLQNIKQNTWLFLFPTAAQPQIICSVRCKQSQTKEKKNLYVPYMIMDHISWKQLTELHRQLLQEAHAAGKEKVAAFLGRLDPVLSDPKNSNKNLLVPWLTQTTDLVLTSWLMKRFLREVKGISQDAISTVWKKSIGWDQLVGSFRSYGVAVQELHKIREALNELWDWEPARLLEEYLAVYVSNAHPISVDWMDLSPVGGNFAATEESPLVQCIEDTISKISLEAERNAYTLYGSGLSFSDEALTNWGDNHSIDTLLEKLQWQTRFYPALSNGINIYEVLAIIIQSMDLGLLGMNTILDRHPYANRRHCSWELYTRQRAGEAGLFLLPIRYRNLLPVLAEIQEKRNEDLEGATFDLVRFIDNLVSGDFTKSVRIANELCMSADQLKRSLFSAYEMLVLGGQKFKEWQCDLHDRRLPDTIQDVANETDRGLKMHFLSTYWNS